jgi:uncharacterized protein (DUF1697 family)
MKSAQPLAPGTRHVALLRGINVGHAKRVAMADLRKLVADLGYADVQTLLNSGNVVFTVPRGAKGDPAERIERAIAAKLGITSRVTVLSAAELTAIAAENPLAAKTSDPTRLFIAVLASAAERPRLRALETEDWAPDVLEVGKRAAYLWCPNGMAQSRLAEEVARALRDAVTTRNGATLAKLQALAQAEAVAGPAAGAKKRSTINAAWHRAHPMPAKPTLAERALWHRDHETACGCRPIPPAVRDWLRANAPKARKK